MDRGAEDRNDAAGSPRSGAFEVAAVGLAVLDPDGAWVREANRHLCALLGHAPGTLAGRPAAALTGDTDAVLVAGIRRWRRADGSPIDLRVRVTRAPESATGAGDPGADRVVVVEPVDADELVRAEQNREALVAAGLGEWSWNRASGEVALSRRAAQIVGYPAGRSADWAAMRDRFDPRDAEGVRAEVADALAQGRPWKFETRFRRGTDDAPVWIRASGQTTLASDGAVAGMVGVVQDVTTRIEARTALAEREQRLRVATSVAALGIFEWHLLDDRATWENERMFAIFGRAPEDGTIGKREFLSEILHPDDRPAFRLAISRALREDAILHASGRIRRPDGAWRVIDMAGRFERDAPGRLPRRLIGVVADVTARRGAEERQSLLIRELHHRVKNTLATVQAIVGSTARTASSIDSFYEAFVGRIKSLSHTHSVLTEDTWQTARLRGLLENELRPYAEGAMDGDRDARIALDGPAVDLPSEIAVPVGMAIHELTTNAAKYGALSTPTGRVAVLWEILPGGRAGTLRLEWRESGGPPAAPPVRQGFGSRLLQRVLTTQVQAEVTTAYPREGFRLVMLAPLPDRTAASNPLA